MKNLGVNGVFIMNKTIGVAVFLLIACIAVSAQTSYKGLTPGKSARAEVERVLGGPSRR